MEKGPGTPALLTTTAFQLVAVEAHLFKLTYIINCIKAQK